jgi:hypothetical protein
MNPLLQPEKTMKMVDALHPAAASASRATAPASASRAATVCRSRRHPLRLWLLASSSLAAALGAIPSTAPWGPAPSARAIIRSVVHRGRRTGSLSSHPSSGPPSSDSTHRIDARVVNNRHACPDRSLPRSSFRPDKVWQRGRTRPAVAGTRPAGYARPAR